MRVSQTRLGAGAALAVVLVVNPLVSLVASAQATPSPSPSAAVRVRPQVQGDRFLVAVDRVKEGAITLELQIRDIEPAAKVATLRALDLDDAGAQVG